MAAWNVAGVTNMREAFYNAELFDQDISRWNVDKVTSMGHMFFGARSFRQNLLQWNVSQVRDLNETFYLQIASSWQAVRRAGNCFERYSNRVNCSSKTQVVLDAEAELAEPRRTLALYYLDTTYTIHGPEHYGFNRSRLFNTFGNQAIEYEAVVEHSDYNHPCHTLPKGCKVQNLLHVDSYTGEILLRPRKRENVKAGSTFTARLIATTATPGSSAVVNEWQFVLQERPRFSATKAWSEVSTGVAALRDPSSKYLSEYTVGETHTLAKPSMTVETMVQDYAGTPQDITYSLLFKKTAAGRDSVARLPFYVDGDGETLAQPKEENIGNFTARLVATDAAGSQAALHNWNFTIAPKPVFSTTAAWRDATSSRGVAALQDPSSNYLPKYTVGETYTLAKPGMAQADLFQGYAGNDPAKIAYSLLFNNTVSGETTDLPFYMNGKGETLAYPAANVIGNFTARLVATDAAGSQAALHNWNFTIAPKPVFSTTAAWRDATSSRGVAALQDPSSNYLPKYTVGETYTLAKPGMAQADLFQGYAGNDPAKIAYSLLFNNTVSGETTDLPFYMNGKGETLAYPAANVIGEYSAALLATDGAGAVASLFSWSFFIVPKPVFSTTAAWRDATSGRGVATLQAPSSNYLPKYTVGETYMLVKPNMTRATMFKDYSGDAAKITYTMNFTDKKTGEGARLPFYVNGEGETLARPKLENIGIFTARLVATDAAGSQAVLYEWEFQVVLQPNFAVLDNWKDEWRNDVLNSTASTTINLTAYQTIYAKGKTYDLDGPPDSSDKMKIFKDAAEDDFESITYSMEFDEVASARPAPGPLLCGPVKSGGKGGGKHPARCPPHLKKVTSKPGKFFVSKEGRVIAMPQNEGAYTGHLIAKDASGARAEVKSWTFKVMPDDKDVPSNGPSGRACQNRGAKVDLRPFDQIFSCDCTGLLNVGGDNCDTLPDTDVREYGPNNRTCENNGVKIDGEPFDKSFTCDCTGLADVEPINCATLPETTTDDQDNTPTYIVSALAAVIVAVFCIYVAVTKYRAYVLANAPEDFEAKLQAFKDQGLIEDLDAVVDKKPRELRRGWLSLVDRLGQGAFGEVWKGLLHDGANTLGATPEYLVAVKSVLNNGNLSADVAAAESELMNEAVFMAHVGVHKNLVSLIGVITRGHPKMLVLSYCEHGELLTSLKKNAADGTPLDDQAKLRFCSEIAHGMTHLGEHNMVHRDLAARNVLLASGMVCKVADFGLSRSTQADDGNSDYYRSTTGMIPVRWTAPEGKACFGRAAHRFRSSSIAFVWRVRNGG